MQKYNRHSDENFIKETNTLMMVVVVERDRFN